MQSEKRPAERSYWPTFTVLEALVVACGMQTVGLLAAIPQMIRLQSHPSPDRNTQTEPDHCL